MGPASARRLSLGFPQVHFCAPGHSRLGPRLNPGAGLYGQLPSWRGPGPG